MKVVVLGGGSSPERAVSLRSAAAVSEALRTAGYEVMEADPANGLEILDSLSKADIVFPILHGAEGEDGVIQGILEEKGLAYLGSNSSCSKQCFDKSITRKLLIEAGLPVAKGEGGITAATYSINPLTKKPHVLKAQRGGSSIGTYLVKNPSKVDQAKVSEVFELDSKAVIEELIDGLEITVPILDKKALPVIEIVPPENGEFDYENKYNGKSQEICPAVSLDESQQHNAQVLAEKVHGVMGCRHLSRIDIMLRKSGEMVVLEANTIPGMTSQSLYPLSAKVAGMPMPELMDKFVKLVTRSS
ncbi:D-alanine--D-alanine ligase [soil metagenome]